MKSFIPYSYLEFNRIVDEFFNDRDVKILERIRKKKFLKNNLLKNKHDFYDALNRNSEPNFVFTSTDGINWSSHTHSISNLSLRSI